MIGRIALIALVLASSGLVVDDAPVVGELVPDLAVPAAASTCDGWPAPVGKALDECPNGPTL